MPSFTFIGNPIQNVLEKLQTLLPGITKVIALYYFNESAELKIKSLIKRSGNENSVEDYDFDGQDGLTMKETDKLRSSTQHIHWYKKDELPFDKKTKKTSAQMDVFHELENVVLSLGFINDHDNKNDIILFYFNQDLSNFGLTGNSKQLTVENKLIIGSLLYNSIKTIIDSAKNDLVLFNTQNEITKSLVKRYNHSKDELERYKSNYGHNLVDLCKSYVKDYSQGKRFNYVLSDDAIAKIRTYNGDIAALRIVIQKAINYVNSLYFDNTKNEIYISEDYLNFENMGTSTASKPQERQLYNDLTKAESLLDRLEKAARFVIAQGNDLTSANVGRAMTPSISAPAISDALKKQKKKLLTLLKREPDKWSLIRTEFRPIKNLLNSQPGIVEKTA